MKPRRFYFHYNKPASLRAGKPLMSVHYMNTCFVVDHVNCNVQCYSHHQNRQPKCVMRGFCGGVNIIPNRNGKQKLLTAIICQ